MARHLKLTLFKKMDLLEPWSFTRTLMTIFLKEFRAELSSMTPRWVSNCSTAKRSNLMTSKYPIQEGDLLWTKSYKGHTELDYSFPKFLTSAAAVLLPLQQKESSPSVIVVDVLNRQ